MLLNATCDSWPHKQTPILIILVNAVQSVRILFTHINVFYTQCVNSRSCVSAHSSTKISPSERIWDPFALPTAFWECFPGNNTAGVWTWPPPSNANEPSSDYGLNDRRSIPDTGRGFFHQVSASRPALGPTQAPIEWVPGALSLGVKRGRGVMLTTHPLLVLRLRKSRSYTSSPPKRDYGV
jgi:hypothetical protein